MLAGLGCALKPRYTGVFVVLECLALLHGLRPFRLKPLVAGATLAAYAAVIALVCPAYLRRAVPLALALYGATDVPLRHLLTESRADVRSGGGDPAVVARRRRMPERSLI